MFSIIGSKSIQGRTERSVQSTDYQENVVSKIDVAKAGVSAEKGGCHRRNVSSELESACKELLGDTERRVYRRLCAKLYIRSRRGIFEGKSRFHQALRVLGKRFVLLIPERIARMNRQLVNGC